MQVQEEVDDTDGQGAPGAPPTASGLERALRALVTGTSHLVALVEGDGQVIFVGPSVRALLGYETAELVGRNVAEFIHPDDLAMAASMLSSEAAHPRAGAEFGSDTDIAGEYRLRHRDGRWIPFEFLRNNFLADPVISGILVIGRPVEVRYALDEALGVLAYDAEGTEALRYLLRYLASRLPGTAAAVLVAGPDREWIAEPELGPVLGSRGPWDTALATGQPVWASVADGTLVEPLLARAADRCGYTACWCLPLPVREARVFIGRNPPVPTGRTEATGCLVVWSRREVVPPTAFIGVLERCGGLAGIALDRRREHRQLRRMVDYDQATGALSRAGMRAVVARSESTPRTHLVFDLDDFKVVNDRHGHSAGDEVLRRVVARVQSVLRGQDLLVRIGGDEFLILLADTDPRAGEKVASRVAAVIAEPVTVGSVSIRVGTSVGIAPWDAGVPFDELTERADRAMYKAKDRGKNCWAFWEPADGRPRLV